MLTLAGNLSQTSEYAKAEDAIWTPLPGPQYEAYHSLADELFYGGAAGGGKTDLLLGLAGTAHYRSILFRRKFPLMRNIIERSREIFNARGSSHAKDSFNESLHIWRLGDGRQIEFGSMQHEWNKEDYKGRPHDLYDWDELPEFTESQFRFVNAWLRSTRPGQRKRIVATGNPPTTLEGEWVIRYWAPWLDPQHSNPAKPGELRWFGTVDGEEVEFLTGESFEHKGQTVLKRSRTFIPARLSDNPYLDSDPDYRAVLQNLPEPLRSQMLEGDFYANKADAPWQVIPTSYVVEAQKRWLNSPEEWRKHGRPILVDGRFMPLTRLGLDVAYGGKDNTVLSRLYGDWFAPLEVHPGTTTADGKITAGYATVALLEGGECNIDGIGWGADAYQRLRDNVGERAHSIIFSGAALDSGDKPLTDKSGKLTFANIRAACYWGLREALAPDSGYEIALPPDAALQADLCTPKYEVRSGKIYVEAKEDIAKRLGGRSTDKGDAVVLAWWEKPIREKRVWRAL